MNSIKFWLIYKYLGIIDIYGYTYKSKIKYDHSNLEYNISIFFNYSYLAVCNLTLKRS